MRGADLSARPPPHSGRMGWGTDVFVGVVDLLCEEPGGCDRASGELRKRCLSGSIGSGLDGNLDFSIRGSIARSLARSIDRSLNWILERIVEGIVEGIIEGIVEGCRSLNGSLDSCSFRGISGVSRTLLLSRALVLNDGGGRSGIYRFSACSCPMYFCPDGRQCLTVDALYDSRRRIGTRDVSATAWGAYKEPASARNTSVKTRGDYHVSATGRKVSLNAWKVSATGRKVSLNAWKVSSTGRNELANTWGAYSAGATTWNGPRSTWGMGIEVGPLRIVSVHIHSAWPEFDDGWGTSRAC
ncbi:hypothetical protein PG991_011820 [Apiospora marii]|uniref:Uncharacterized protein n=1 Tax=Apiospora marii TaxID=335849 RepID=A0ABR1RF94_9PEZI